MTSAEDFADGLEDQPHIYQARPAAEGVVVALQLSATQDHPTMFSHDEYRCVAMVPDERGNTWVFTNHDPPEDYNDDS